MQISWSEFFRQFINFSNMLEPLWVTIYMVAIAIFFSMLIGFPIGILLVITKEHHIAPSKTINKTLDMIIVNITRSIPFIILMVILIPFSRMILGKSFGTEAFIVNLSIGSAPFIARIVEGALSEVDTGLIEASKALGASNATIIRKVLLPEAAPALIHGIVLAIITVIGYSAMAGTIGGEGLGKVAVIDGFNRSDYVIIWQATFLIILLVQVIQFIGNLLVKKIYKKRGK